MMSLKTDVISHEEFDKILAELVWQTGPVCLLTIPGVYEVLSEHYHNAVIEVWERRR